MPLEVLQEIYFNVPTSGLCALSKASKSLSKTIEPYLCRQIDFCWREPKRAPLVHLLVRTLLHHPSLALHVQTLTLRAEEPFRSLWWSRVETRDPLCNCVYDDDDEGVSGSLTIEELGTMREATETLLGLGWSMVWLNDWAEGDRDAFIVLLIALLSNLRAIHLDTELQKFAQELHTCEVDGSSPGSSRYPKLEVASLNCELSQSGLVSDSRIVWKAAGIFSPDLPSVLTLFLALS